MSPADLKARQTPFKDKYREQPKSARATLTARGRVHVDSITVEILRDAPVPAIMGLHPLTGGDGASACAAERLLEALVGCAGVTLGAVCTALEIPTREVLLTASGQLDFRGTLGVSRDVPVGFESIQLKFEIASPAPDEKLAKAVQLAERYCVVAQTLKSVSAEWSRLD